MECKRLESALVAEREAREAAELSFDMAGTMAQIDAKCIADLQARLAASEAGRAALRQAIVEPALILESLNASIKWELAPTIKEQIRKCLGPMRAALTADAGRALLDEKAAMKRANSRFREWFLAMYRDDFSGPKVKNACLTAMAEADCRTTAEVEAAWRATKGQQP